MTVITATARHITYVRLAGATTVNDTNTGRKIGQCDLIHGFAHYYGVTGSAHEGFHAVIRGGLDGLRIALADGIRNGHDDRS